MTWVGIKKDDIKPDMYLELSEHPLVSSNVGIISIKNQVEIKDGFKTKVLHLDNCLTDARATSYI